MATPDELLDAFAASWRAGEAPDAGRWLQRADPADRDELADLLEGFLLVADDVAPSAARRAELEAEPGFERLLAIVEQTGPQERPAAVAAWGRRLRELRERAGLGLEALADRFAASFDLDAAGERAGRYLAELERGELDPRGVSTRAAFRLEELLGAGAGSLLPPAAVTFRSEDAGPASAPTEAVGAPPDHDPGEEEADAADLLRLAADALDRPAAHEWDELDELLRGG